MSGAITTGIFTLIGAAIGGGLAQVGPIVSSISQGRQQRAKAAMDWAQARLEKRNPLYVDLITRADETARHVQKLEVMYSMGCPDDNQNIRSLRHVISGNLDSIFALGSKVKIEGSERAAKIAGKLLDDIADLAEDLTLDADDEAFTEGSVAKAKDGLRAAASELVVAAREDFGIGL